MKTDQKAMRALSALGRPAGHAHGLYADFQGQLAALVDDDGNLVPEARAQWLVIHERVTAGTSEQECCD